jgi:pyrroloquinoline quinone (PQQ) biosynthesis protein C
MTGQPYDGRSRTAPAWSSGKSPEHFETELVELAVKTQMEAFGRTRMPEDLDREQARLYHATWLQNFSYFAWRFPSWLLDIGSRCPYQDVRREIIQDCVDEEVGDEDAGGRCHIDVLYEEAEACGLSRDQITAAEPTPVVHACVLALDDLARTLSWEASYASVAALEIVSSKPAVEFRNSILTEEQKSMTLGAQANTLADRLGIESDGLLFNALHAYKDQFHGGGELAILVKYAVDERIQREMLWAAKTSLQVMGVMMKEISRLSHEAVGR